MNVSAEAPSESESESEAPKAPAAGQALCICSDAQMLRPDAIRAAHTLRMRSGFELLLLLPLLLLVLVG